MLQVKLSAASASAWPLDVQTLGAETVCVSSRLGSGLDELEGAAATNGCSSTSSVGNATLEFCLCVLSLLIRGVGQTSVSEGSLQEARCFFPETLEVEQAWLFFSEVCVQVSMDTDFGARNLNGRLSEDKRHPTGCVATRLDYSLLKVSGHGSQPPHPAPFGTGARVVVKKFWGRQYLHRLPQLAPPKRVVRLHKAAASVSTDPP